MGIHQKYFSGQDGLKVNNFLRKDDQPTQVQETGVGPERDQLISEQRSPTETDYLDTADQDMFKSIDDKSYEEYFGKGQAVDQPEDNIRKLSRDSEDLFGEEDLLRPSEVFKALKDDDPNITPESSDQEIGSDLGFNAKRPSNGLNQKSPLGNGKDLTVPPINVKQNSGRKPAKA
jgi:hypothetical protein